jgi:hypothetical protein
LFIVSQRVSLFMLHNSEGSAKGANGNVKALVCNGQYSLPAWPDGALGVVVRLEVESASTRTTFYFDSNPLCFDSNHGGYRAVTCGGGISQAMAKQLGGHVKGCEW